MRASQLIAILKKNVNELGDFEVVIENSHYGSNDVTLDPLAGVHIISSADDSVPNKDPVYFLHHS